MDLRCLKSLVVEEPDLRGRRAAATVRIVGIDGCKSSCRIMLTYELPIEEAWRPLIRLAFSIPVLNYSLFCDAIRLDFPLRRADARLLDDLNGIFARDIFVTKLVVDPMPHLFLKHLPLEAEVTEENARPRAQLVPAAVEADSALGRVFRADACGVLSSGGKESLLTYAMLREIGGDVYPVYVNESGGHWRTAMTAYRHHVSSERLTCRVWTNVDRFYNFMLDHLAIVRPNHRRIRADAYPIRSCIFPFYVVAALPLLLRHGVGNLLLGSEFHDIRTQPCFRGIHHHSGTYDQTQEFDLRMEEWYCSSLPGMRQWSAVRAVTGLIVERILTKRYPRLAPLQRSCHSCGIAAGKAVPCGVCSKCLEVQMYLNANGVNPKVMGYRDADAAAFASRLAGAALRLAPEERQHASYLCAQNGFPVEGKPHPHVEGIHVLPPACNPNLLPARFRRPVLDILEACTNGYWTLDGDEWHPMAGAVDVL